MDLALLAITCIINLILGVTILVRDSSKTHTRLFMLMSVVISLWIVSNYFTNHFFGSVLLIETANRVAYMTGYGIVLSGLLFTYFFPIARRPNQHETVLLSIVAIVTLILSLTPLVAGEVIIEGGVVSFGAGPLVWIYLVSFLGTVVVIARNLTRFPRAVPPRIRRQARYILLAFVLSALVGLTLNLVIPLIASGWQVTRFGPLSTVFLVAVIAYTIIRHGLFDIRGAIVRTATYSLTIATVVGVYGLIALVGLTSFLGFERISLTQQAGLLTITLLIGISIPFLVRFFDKLTRRVFFRGVYESHVAINEMTEIFTDSPSLRQLLIESSDHLQHILGAEFVSVSLTKSDDPALQQLAHTSLDSHDSHDLPHETLQYMTSKDVKMLFADAFGENNAKLEDELRRSGVAIAAQLNPASAVLGYMIIGHKLNGTAYTKQDLDLIDIISDELAIAVQNMLRFQEIAEFNAELQHRIDEATAQLRQNNKKLHMLDKSKDEFISMASHQLRTPLTAVKGYISMVLEGDAGKITGAQRKVLEEAFNSSQRMVYLISDFLNVSRLQTGKFELERSEVQLPDIITEELAQLKASAQARKVTLNYTPPSSFPTISLDENKIRQVMMNFIDNAIYYARPDGGTITVTLAKYSSHVSFRVIDNGIGVPKSEQRQLFTKFYRASNARQARPDGTGIGLFMAKKVIVAHGGAIIFESKEGQGSTFGFRLPLEDSAK